MFTRISAIGGFLALAVLFMGVPQDTHALSCVAPESNASFIANGGVIFHGTVISNNATAVTGTGAETRDVTFSVDRAWGNTRINTPFTVRDNIPAGVPGENDIWGFRSTFEEGRQYTVHASFDGGTYIADIGACARSATGYQSLSDELGSGYVPNQTSTPPSDSFTDGLLKQIQELLALVASLQEQLRQQTGGGVFVTDFESCTAVTGVVLESYPRKCVYNGRTYVEVIDTPITPVPTPPVTCPNFDRNLWVGVEGSDVIQLQQFLQSAGTYTYPEITGYFGPATQQAVQAWQAQQGIVSSGTAASTGYGVVGPATRAAISRMCVPDRTPVACTLEYAPVCGQPSGCEPCNAPDGLACPAICKLKQPQTYGNMCQLRADGAQFLYQGQCRDTDDRTPPNNCRVWNDGCNTCSRTYPGGPLACTQRACIWEGVSKCEAYFDDTVGGSDPVIHSFTGPTTLSVSETGVWNISASDPQNGSLSYKIDWGEKRYNSAFDSIAALANSGFVQQTSFSHSYAHAGTYTITITVKDQQGLTATTTTTVRVGGTETGEGFVVSGPTNTASRTVTATITLPPRSGFDLIEVCGPIVVGELDWGDGSTERPTRLGCSSQRVVTVTHTYTTNGTYNVVFTRNDDVRFTERVTVGADSPFPTGVTFNVSPSTGTSPLTVTFSAPGGSSCVDGPDYKIEFGDGQSAQTPSCTSGVQQVRHTYTNAGVYSAVLYSIPSGFGTGDRTPRAVATRTIIVGGTASNTCLSGDVSYAEGTRKSCIDTDSGTSQCIADAQYVCRSGQWVIEADPWGPTCRSGTNYGGGYYEHCDTPNDTLSVFEPSGGSYNMGDQIRVRWTTNVLNSNAAMYLVLEDEQTGKRFKSMKVNRAAGQAIFDTGGSCNFFFSDGIDGGCTSLRNNIFDGGLRYRIKAVIYTPANACFGFCAPGSVTTTQSLVESYSTAFTLNI